MPWISINQAGKSHFKIIIYRLSLSEEIKNTKVSREPLAFVGGKNIYLLRLNPIKKKKNILFL